MQRQYLSFLISTFFSKLKVIQNILCMSINLKNRSFLKLLDFTTAELEYLLDISAELKVSKKTGTEKALLTNKNIVLIFEKSSTRTRCAFEVAAYDQGANITYLSPSGSQMRKKESLKDTARVLGRMYDAIEYRGFGQEIVELLAKYSGVPVWNGLTDEFHPTQILADLLTMKEHSLKPLNNITLCYMGDARNNMGNSLMVGAAKMGIDYRAAAPKAFQPKDNLIKICNEIASQTGAKITITEDIKVAVKGADFIYTDVWVSMGEPSTVWDDRIKLLKPYQVNKQLLELVNNSEVKFMHCLPANHNRETELGEEIYRKFGIDAMEVTDDIFESEASIVFDQAENRLHTIKAIMVTTLT